MNMIMRIVKKVVRKLFPSFYLDRMAKKFDTSAVIYKKMTYKSFLEQAFKDFRPELSFADKKKLEHDILRTYLLDQTRPDEYLLYHYDTKSETERNVKILFQGLVGFYAKVVHRITRILYPVLVH